MSKIYHFLLVCISLMLLSTNLFAAKRDHKLFSFLPPESGWHCPALFWYSSSSSTSSSSDSCKHIVWIVENKTEKLNKFVENNASVLREQTSKGNGIVVNDYAKLLGCTNETVFSQVMQKNYDVI